MSCERPIFKVGAIVEALSCTAKPFHCSKHAQQCSQCFDFGVFQRPIAHEFPIHVWKSQNHLPNLTCQSTTIAPKHCLETWHPYFVQAIGPTYLPTPPTYHLGEAIKCLNELWRWHQRFRRDWLHVLGVLLLWIRVNFYLFINQTFVHRTSTFSIIYMQHHFIKLKIH